MYGPVSGILRSVGGRNFPDVLGLMGPLKETTIGRHVRRYTRIEKIHREDRFLRHHCTSRRIVLRHVHQTHAAAGMSLYAAKSRRER